MDIDEDLDLDDLFEIDVEESADASKVLEVVEEDHSTPVGFIPLDNATDQPSEAVSREVSKEDTESKAASKDESSEVDEAEEARRWPLMIIAQRRRAKDPLRRWGLPAKKRKVDMDKRSRMFAELITDELGKCWVCGEADLHTSQECPHAKCLRCGKVTQHVSATCPETIKCVLCNVWGHTADDCPMQVLLFADKDTKDVRCLVCGEKGHLNCADLSLICPSADGGGKKDGFKLINATSAALENFRGTEDDEFEIKMVDDVRDSRGGSYGNGRYGNNDRYGYGGRYDNYDRYNSGKGGKHSGKGGKKGKGKGKGKWGRQSAPPMGQPLGSQISTSMGQPLGSQISLPDDIGYGELVGQQQHWRGNNNYGSGGYGGNYHSGKGKKGGKAKGGKGSFKGGKDFDRRSSAPPATDYSHNVPLGGGILGASSSDRPANMPVTQNIPIVVPQNGNGGSKKIVDNDEEMHLDLDLDLDSPPVAKPAQKPPNAPTTQQNLSKPTAKASKSTQNDEEMDLDLDLGGEWEEVEVPRAVVSRNSSGGMKLGLSNRQAEDDLHKEIKDFDYEMPKMKMKPMIPPASSPSSGAKKPSVLSALSALPKPSEGGSGSAGSFLSSLPKVGGGGGGARPSSPQKTPAAAAKSDDDDEDSSDDDDSPKQKGLPPPAF